MASKCISTIDKGFLDKKLKFNQDAAMNIALLMFTYIDVVPFLSKFDKVSTADRAKLNEKIVVKIMSMIAQAYISIVNKKLNSDLLDDPKSDLSNCIEPMSLHDDPDESSDKWNSSEFISINAPIYSTPKKSYPSAGPGECRQEVCPKFNLDKPVTPLLTYGSSKLVLRPPMPAYDGCLLPQKQFAKSCEFPLNCAVKTGSNYPMTHLNGVKTYDFSTQPNAFQRFHASIGKPEIMHDLQYNSNFLVPSGASQFPMNHCANKFVSQEYYQSFKSADVCDTKPKHFPINCFIPPYYTAFPPDVASLQSPNVCSTRSDIMPTNYKCSPPSSPRVQSHPDLDSLKTTGVYVAGRPSRLPLFSGYGSQSGLPHPDFDSRQLSNEIHTASANGSSARSMVPYHSVRNQSILRPANQCYSPPVQSLLAEELCVLSTSVHLNEISSDSLEPISEIQAMECKSTTNLEVDFAQSYRVFSDNSLHSNYRNAFTLPANIQDYTLNLCSSTDFYGAPLVPAELKSTYIDHNKTNEVDINKSIDKIDNVKSSITNNDKDDDIRINSKINDSVSSPKATSEHKVTSDFFRKLKLYIQDTVSPSKADRNQSEDKITETANKSSVDACDSIHNASPQVKECVVKVSVKNLIRRFEQC